MPKLAAVRLFAAVVLLSAVTSTIFAAGLASPAAASPAGWSSGTLIDPHPGDLLHSPAQRRPSAPRWT